MQERQEMWVWSLGQEDTLEREMATHSSIFAWKILWTEEPRRVHTVHWVTKSQTCSWARTHTYMASGYLSRYKPHIHHPGAIIRSRWFSSVQSLSHVWLFATPWTAARQASLPITNSQSLPKLMSLKSVMPSNHLIPVIPFSSRPQSFPASRSFPVSQFFASGGQSIGVSASTSVLPMNTRTDLV